MLLDDALGDLQDGLVVFGGGLSSRPWACSRVQSGLLMSRPVAMAICEWSSYFVGLVRRLLGRRRIRASD